MTLPFFLSYLVFGKNGSIRKAGGILLVTMFAIANNIRTTDKTLLSGASSPLP